MTKRKTCGICSRITRRDLDRRYCPIIAACIHPDRPADSCKFFLKGQRRPSSRDDYYEEDE